MHLRSIELQMPNRAAAVEFLTGQWGLATVVTCRDTTYLRGTGAHHYAIAVSEGPARAVLSATVIGTRAEVETIWDRIRKAGLKHGAWIDEFDEPGRGAGFYAAGPEGEPYGFVAECEAAPAALPAGNARPIQVAHVVFNTRDREGATRVLVDAFGFKLSDRTRVMNFMRCDDLHHVVAYAGSKQASLNHIAFEMCDTDAVMRGMGRLKDGTRALRASGDPAATVRAITCSPTSSRHSAPASSTPLKFSAWTIATRRVRRTPGAGHPGAPTTGASPAATMKSLQPRATPSVTGR